MELGSPSPRSIPRPYTPVTWDISVARTLPDVSLVSTRSFLDVVEARTSRREFFPLNIEALSALLWHTCRTKQQELSNLGFTLERRPVPSAGAIHPIHVLVASRTSLEKYDSVGHQLGLLNVTNELLSRIWNDVESVLPAPFSVAIIFVGETGKTSAKYVNAESLIWRDSGVLQGHMALVAEVLDLNYCPLGITGEAWARELNAKGQLVGVGVALVGGRHP